MSWVRASLAALVALAASVGIVTVSAEPAAAWSDGACTDDAGVSVVVDFQDLGGGVITRCAHVQAGATGLDALNAAGVNVEGTSRYGQAFVCRLGGKPAADQDLPILGDEGYRESCVDTPPGAARWSYWSAPNGGSWTSSSKGATARTVTIGGYEGWSFSLNAAASGNPAPRVTPSHPVKAPPAAEAAGGSDSQGTGGGAAGTAAQANGSAQGAGSAGAGSAGGSGSAENAGGAQQAPDPAAPASAPSAEGELQKPQNQGEESVTGAAGTDSPTENVLGAPAAPAGGIPVGTVVSLGLIALIGGAGAATWWLRRRHGVR